MGSGTVAKMGAADAAVSTHWADGGQGAEQLAAAVVKASERPAQFKHLYDVSWPIKKKIETIATTMYGAAGVTFEPEAERDIELATQWDLATYPFAWRRLLCPCHTIPL